MLLDDADRKKFCEWLRANIATSEGMVRQMETMSLPPVIIQREKQELVAMAVVLNKLDKTESATIGG